MIDRFGDKDSSRSVCSPDPTERDGDDIIIVYVHARSFLWIVTNGVHGRRDDNMLSIGAREPGVEKLAICI